jgi:hypothetical protein
LSTWPSTIRRLVSEASLAVGSVPGYLLVYRRPARWQEAVSLVDGLAGVEAIGGSARDCLRSRVTPRDLNGAGAVETVVVR